MVLLQAVQNLEMLDLILVAATTLGLKDCHELNKTLTHK